MIWFVRVALQRPYTFVVIAFLILLFGPLAALRTPTDIFPDIKIPVISVVWQYNGLSPKDMSGRVIYYYERALSSTVNDIEHVESQSMLGLGVVKIFFQPTVDIRTATAQVTSISQTVLKQMPPGITPPLILNYNASTVPIIQLAMSSAKLSDMKIFDYGQNFIRPALATVRGSAVPSPYGGKVRQIQVDLDPIALQSKGLSAQDIEKALAEQNQVIPAGTIKIGQYEYFVGLNDAVDSVEDVMNLPIKAVNGTIIYIRDVAHVRDGYPPQTNKVRMDSHQAILMTILKSGSSSTLDVIDGVKKILPRLEETLPKSLKIKLLSDQSLFVKSAVFGVVREGLIAASLTCIMILVFLGSWRSTVIIATSIPLALLSALILLAVNGETLNVMTLGGLALAVGILVDDGTVTIENINWHLEHGKQVVPAILDGAAQIVTPALVSLLCICIVFVPMFFLQGISGFLFVPMAKAVIFSLVSSFFLSRTLVPTMAKYLLKAHDHGSLAATDSAGPHLHGPSTDRGWKSPFLAFQAGFERRFSRVRVIYVRFLRMALVWNKPFMIGFLAIVILSMGLLPFLGRNFFPSVEADQINIHVRAPSGTRIEETANLFDHVEKTIHQLLPGQVDTIVDNMDLPYSGINSAYSNTGTIGPQDGDIMVSLKEDHGDTDAFVKKLRTELPQRFPGIQFAYLPADIISQILNFGNPAPINIMVAGPRIGENMEYIRAIMRRVRLVPGIADVRIQQVSNYPELKVMVNRSLAQTVGVTERDVTTSLNVNLSGSFQSAPSFWLNPKNGVSYPIVAQAPQYWLDNMSQLVNMPVTAAAAKYPQVLGGIARLHRTAVDAVVSHYNIQPSFNIYAAVQGRDLGAVSDDINTILKDMAPGRPKGSVVRLLGQVKTMNIAFTELGFGLLASIVLIYAIIVINFQSWLDPFVIITALPAGLAGIVWMLFITHTTLSVPALTGAIMTMGVATANSVLVITFARERLEYHRDAFKAAVDAGFTRFRPVCMTALAMIIGMLPMALSTDTNAPLGRAVIGGLILATISTLLFVPTVFYRVHARDFEHAEELQS